MPYALLEEVMRRQAEARKNMPRLTSVRGEIVKRIVQDLLVPYLLENLEKHGTPVIPSPPPPVDTAIPRIDPLLLQAYEPATEDTGAYRLWCTTPARRLTRFHLLKQECRPVNEAEGNERLEAARASYVLLRFVCLLDMLGREATGALKEVIEAAASTAKAELRVCGRTVWQWGDTLQSPRT